MRSPPARKLRAPAQALRAALEERARERIARTPAADPRACWEAVRRAHVEELLAGGGRDEDSTFEAIAAFHESLLDLEPGIAHTEMSRLRRGALEVVVPGRAPGAVETIPAGRFYLRAGLARKQSGAWYTPAAFVRFLVREALAPLAADADAERILELRVLDPAMGTGVFLVEACRFLAGALERRGVEPGEARRLVASRCLHGVDRCGFTAEVARLSLAAFAGLAPEALAARLVEGDSLEAPIRPPAPSGAFCFGARFPEAFARGGFDAVVGNPPWEAVQPDAREFFARYDLSILDAPTRRERRAIEERLLRDPAIAEAWDAYRGELRRARARIAAHHLHVHRGEKGAAGNADLWQPFAERSLLLLRAGGRLGLVLPSAFHANQGATALRALYLDEARLERCYSFENRRRLFAIDSRCKYALVVAERGGRTEEVACGFYLHDPAWLDAHEARALRCSRAFLERSGGPARAFWELRDRRDLAIAEACLSHGRTFGDHLRERGLDFYREADMTNDAHRFVPAGAAGALALHEGKTFHQYDARWEPPRYAVPLAALADRPGWLEASRCFRLAYRAVASSTNERTAIFALLPPGVVCGNSAPVERDPSRRPLRAALATLALGNSFTFDWLLRQRGGTNVNRFLLRDVPAPPLDEASLDALAEAALALTCADPAFAPLSPPRALSAEDGLALRAAIDVRVARAYGLDEEAYGRVLDSFPAAGQRALAAACRLAWRTSA